MQVTEALLVGDELDAPFAAALVEHEDVARRNRARIAPDLLVPAVGEAVLGVELQLVDAQLAQRGDQRVQCARSWDARAADIEHHAAHREVGRVGDREARHDEVRGVLRRGQLLHDLAQALHAVAHAGFVGSLEHELVSARAEFEPLRRQLRPHADAQLAAVRSRSGDRVDRALEQPLQPSVDERKQPLRIANEHDAQRERQLERPAFEAGALRRRAEQSEVDHALPGAALPTSARPSPSRRAAARRRPRAPGRAGP